MKMTQTEFDRIVTDIFDIRDRFCSAMPILEFLEIHPAKGWTDTKYQYVVGRILEEETALSIA